MSGQAIFKSNFLIVYYDLESAIQEYINYGHNRGEVEKIDAYLTATIHAVIDYSERFWDGETEIIKAFKYANNVLKHNKMLISHRKTIGGVHFPIQFPLEFSPIAVIWNYDDKVESRYSEQQKAFENILAGKDIIETFQPIVEQISNDGT